MKALMGFVFVLGQAVYGPVLADPTMSALWPNADGTGWIYQQTYSEADWCGDIQASNEARFYFDGADVVPGGIVVQNLKVEVHGTAPSGFAIDAPSAVRGDPFYRTLWRARPDLREKIRAEAASGKIAPWPDSTFYLNLLHEAAYRKSDEDIAAYRRDQVAMKSWLWLESDLTIGHGFRIQLVPDLADDVWLYGTNAAWEDVEVPAGSFAGCLRVDYRIDYGEGVCTDETGTETGRFRSETRGWVHYAPDVGPLDCHEEFVPITEIIQGKCPFGDLGEHVGEICTTGDLRLLEIQPVPTRPTSWGRIRRDFR